MHLNVASYTNIGGRNENEDSIYVQQTEDLILAAVADGLGGHGGGKIASECAIQMLQEQQERLFSADESVLEAVCAEINEAVLSRQSATIRMKTTLALAIISPDKLAFLHVGDSRIYLFRQGAIRYQSQDHSVSQIAVLTGAIKPEQIRFHEDRNKVLRSLGSENGAAPEIKIEAEPLYAGDAVLLCTDGFWEYVTEKEMANLLKPAKNAEDWLKRMTRVVQRRAKKGNDNNSAIAIFAPKPAKKSLWRKSEDDQTMQ